MNDPERDTKFQGFAKLLTDELIQQTPLGISDEVEKIIARRAYDLVDFAIFHIAVEMSKDSAVMFLPRSDVVKYIPDITELPKEQCPHCSWELSACDCEEDEEDNDD